MEKLTDKSPMKIKQSKYIAILYNGSLVFNNQIFFTDKSYVFSDKDNSKFFLNQRKKENYIKTSSYFSNYKNKYLGY